MVILIDFIGWKSLNRDQAAAWNIGEIEAKNTGTREVKQGDFPLFENYQRANSE